MKNLLLKLWPLVWVGFGHAPSPPLSPQAIYRVVAKREGGKVNLPIAQINEAGRHTLDVLAEKWAANPRRVIAELERRIEERKNSEQAIPQTEVTISSVTLNGTSIVDRGDK